MLTISDADISLRIEKDNPWWSANDCVIPEGELRRRVYFRPFMDLALDFSVRRATILLGPRRVGKTVMVKQLVSDAIKSGISGECILYASIDAPIYSGMPLDKFVFLLQSREGKGQKIMIFDEIQYLTDWEVHLKDLVDTHKDIKFIVTGSATAALKLKSKESGAGRFSNFMLPPLTFYEFLCFIDKDEELIKVDNADFCRPYKAIDIGRLNACFVDYLNYGGYPEAVVNESIRKNPDQFIKNDIIDKVLLKDLPSLYGITHVKELNHLFSVLAYNSGHEVSLEQISQKSGVSKNTISRYIEYLESAFLIIKVSRVDQNSKCMLRETNFKIYLNNPSMRAALFTPVQQDDFDQIGHLAESAVFSQWQHSDAFRRLRYGRWKRNGIEGEIDIVYLDGPENKPFWVGEVKWSDRIKNNFNSETKSMELFMRKHDSVLSALFTTKTYSAEADVCGRNLEVIPTSLYCYMVGRNATNGFIIRSSTSKAARKTTRDERDER
jgi:uncharacterized protein